MLVLSLDDIYYRLSWKVYALTPTHSSNPQPPSFFLPLTIRALGASFENPLSL